MKRFRFPLQAALDYALHKEELEEMQLHELLASRNRLTGEQRQTLSRLRSAEEELVSKSQIRADELAVYESYITSLRRKLEDMARRLHELEGRIGRQKLAVIDAVKKRKTLDKLKERRLDDHRRESDRLAQHESDDLHLTRLNR